jgi:hypothetical protein
MNIEQGLTNRELRSEYLLRISYFACPSYPSADGAGGLIDDLKSIVPVRSNSDSSERRWSFWLLKIIINKKGALTSIPYNFIILFQLRIIVYRSPITDHPQCKNCSTSFIVSS